MGHISYTTCADLFLDSVDEKLKAGVIDGPQIRTLIRDKEFVKSMNAIESAPWNSFV